MFIEPFDIVTSGTEVYNEGEHGVIKGVGDETI